ncbi:hypothetical protein F5887DRAFT_190461 [Amanita rubescens]|nr:hypothetical protein F5887DRAFT_190461 [Amanita rubescens]
MRGLRLASSSILRDWWGMNGYRDAKLRRWKRHRTAKKHKPSSDSTRELSPIDRLPREVLAEIFVQCLPEIELWPKIEGVSTCQDIAPLLLCSVCPPWRALAHSTPRLWQRLFLRFTKVTRTTSVEEVITMMHTWIERSGVLPLTLRLEACLLHGHPAGFQAMICAVLLVLSHYSSRWEHVDFSFIACPSVIFPQIGHTPRLRSFRMNAKDHGGAPILLSCPQLTGISWSLWCTVSSMPNLPWRHLTHIAFARAISSQETLLVIQSSPKLTDIQVALRDAPYEPPPYGRVAIANSLRKLQLRVHQTCGPLLEKLALPALTDLSIEFRYASAAPLRDVHEEILRLFDRSKCKLDRLALLDCSFDDIALLKCLRHRSCASLTELGVLNTCYMPIFTDNVFVALADTPTGKDGLLLPNLARLSLEMCFDGSPGALGLMIFSRCVFWDKEDQLQSLDLRFAEIDQLDFALIRLAESEGLKVEFTRTVKVYDEPSENLDDGYF